MLCCQNYCGLCFNCESWDTKIEERVEALPCEASLGVIVCRFLVCGSFTNRGLRGKKSTPSVDWEVPVKS